MKKLLLKDISPAIIGPDLDHYRHKEIAAVLRLVAQVCRGCHVSQRRGRAWIFVPPSRSSESIKQNKNLLTLWARKSGSSLVIRRKRRGRGIDPSSPAPEPYDESKLEKYKGRLIELIREMAPGDMSEPAASSPPVPQPFTGRLRRTSQNRGSTTEDAAIHDMEEEAEIRRKAGHVAEKIALESERERLRHARREDLARKVRIVSNRPRLGYDILSFETDGRVRIIEVKNVTKGKRFFLSANELSVSRNSCNYWFYLVNEDVDGRPRVEHFSAQALQKCHLTPTQYRIEFGSSRMPL